jgi:hypothetical protein
MVLSTGSPLAADDYWYTVKLENGREAKGTFQFKEMYLLDENTFSLTVFFMIFIDNERPKK